MALKHLSVSNEKTPKFNDILSKYLVKPMEAINQRNGSNYTVKL